MKIELIQAITISVALVGAILGILNTWNSIKKERVRLKVYPSNAYKFYQTIGGEVKYEEGISIDIINLSYFPVTIAELGFANFYIFSNKLRGAKSLPLNFENPGGASLPYRLETRDSIYFYLNESYFERKDLFQKNKYVYARTACGKFFKGKNKEFDRFIETNYSSKNNA